MFNATYVLSSLFIYFFSLISWYLTLSNQRKNYLQKNKSLLDVSNHGNWFIVSKCSSLVDLTRQSLSTADTVDSKQAMFCRITQAYGMDFDPILNSFKFQSQKCNVHAIPSPNNCLNYADYLKRCSWIIAQPVKATWFRFLESDQLYDDSMAKYNAFS